MRMIIKTKKLLNKKLTKIKIFKNIICESLIKILIKIINKSLYISHILVQIKIFNSFMEIILICFIIFFDRIFGIKFYNYI